MIVLAAAVLAQFADVATWSLMPRWAELNVLVREMHTPEAWLAKGLLLVVVLGIQPALRPKYRAVGELVAVVAIAMGSLGAGSNLAVISWVG